MKKNNTEEFPEHFFYTALDIIGANPFVFVPEDILLQLFKDAGKDKGAIPICGSVNGKPYKQTLVRYSGDWRLYINTTMLKDSPKRVGERLQISIDFDPRDRSIAPHPAFLAALKNNPKAKKTFESLIPSRRKEILRYIASLKTEESRNRNIERAIGFLIGNNRFVGRDKP